MKIIKLEKILESERIKKEAISLIKEGKVFVHPTDTVYGLGCNAENPEAVRRIRDIKKTTHPFSVIAPSKKWIKENLIVSKPSCLEKLPGPYTLIFRKKKPFLKEASSNNKLGVRIPAHQLTKVIQKSGKSFITTSCNISGRETIASVNNIPKEIENKVDVIIDGGLLENPPSKIIDLSGKEAKTIR